MCSRKVVILILVVSVSHLFTWAQFTTVIPHSFTPGDASVAQSERWSPLHNPAALQSESAYSIGLIYENRYFAPQLSNALLYGVIPTRFVHIGLTFTFFGYSLYHEMLAALSLSRQLGRFILGIECDYYTLFLSASERYRGCLTAQVGALFRATSHLQLGFSWFNPLFSQIHTIPHKRLPIRLALGADWMFHKQFHWLLQLEMQMQTPFRVATGVSYRLVNEVSVGLGVSIREHVVPNIVVHFMYQGLRFSIQSSYTYPLGATLSGQFAYIFL